MAAPPVKAEISAPYPTPSNATMRTGMGKFWDYAIGLLGSTGNAIDARTALGILTHGQCRLVKSGANLVLQRRNGNQLLINGVTQTIPAAGVSLAPTALAASTIHYIYAYMNAGVMTLEASTTTHATDTTTGVEIKSGDATRTLVGMARTNATPAWVYSATDKSVRSWFNDDGIAAGGASASQTTTSTARANVSNVPINALLWAGEQVTANASGTILAGAAATGSTLTTAIAINGVSAGNDSVTTAVNNEYAPYSCIAYQDIATDGYHTYQTYASTSIATSSNWAAIYVNVTSRRTNA